MAKVLPITSEQYLTMCPRRFGSRNPERTVNPVWEWMVREGHNPYSARQSLGLKSNYRQPGDPEWCFDRFGASRLKWPDGRVITIAGEHEDSYDPDFCIYNDIVVQHHDKIEIYGYPRNVFPPTDFHTATLVGANIVIVGSLGYMDERHFGSTPVFRLDTGTYRIEPLTTTGDMPGWIHNHRAALLEDANAIEITGGDVAAADGGTQRFRENVDTYRLLLDNHEWRRMTDHGHWRQFSIAYTQEQMHPRELLASKDSLKKALSWRSGSALTNLGFPYKLFEESEDEGEDEHEVRYRSHYIFVDDVAVRCADHYRDIRITIEGSLPQVTIDHLLATLADVTRSTNRNVTSIEEL